MVFVVVAAAIVALWFPLLLKLNVCQLLDHYLITHYIGVLGFKQTTKRRGNKTVPLNS